MLQGSERYRNYFEIAHNSYQVIYRLLQQVEKEGYWEEANNVLELSIYDTFDLYMQSILLELCVRTKREHELTKQLLCSLPTNNMLEVDCLQAYSKDAKALAKQLLRTPPIVLQICSLYDYQKHADFAIMFVDHMLTILLSFSKLECKCEKETLAYMEQYYENVIKFLRDEDVQLHLSRKYFFKKMSSEQIHSLELDTVKSESNKEQSTYDELIKELDSLIGLDNVKEQIKTLVNLIKVHKLREQYHMPKPKMTYHMIFTGNPGTGKTTVARMIAAIYKELGLLSKGNFVETDRSGLVAGYVGQTALKVKEVVEQAIGGVLFIDEAYSLANDMGGSDYGKEAIDTLVKMMEDHRDDLVIILAGYTKEMNTLIESNSGLVSRFNTFLNFEDYSDDELTQIFLCMSRKMGMKVTADGLKKFHHEMETMSKKDKNKFGNARGVRNVFEKMLMNQANRIISAQLTDQQAVATVEACDITFQ